MVKLNWERTKVDIQQLLETYKDLPLENQELYFYPINTGMNSKKKEIKETERERQKISNRKNGYNILIGGDNLPILSKLLNHYQGKIQLIYIDPPFATGGNFDFKIKIGEKKKGKRKRRITRQAYDDTWENGLDSYLDFLSVRLALMKRLLAAHGSIYVHIDYRASHYLKILMDEIFGEENFRNEIIWSYPAASAQTKKYFVRSYDTILFYTKTDEYIFNDDPHIYMEYSDRVKNSLKEDENGLFYYRGGSHDGKKLSRKVYVDKPGIFPRDVWTEIPYIRANTKEYQGLSTQKPERLLKRIILASSNEGNLVADFFCGSGTTLAVAEKLKRKWIGVDINKYSIYLTKKRMLDIARTHDILNWKKDYNHPPTPFYLKYQRVPIAEQVPKEFLKAESSEIQGFCKPHLDIEIKFNKEENRVKIELKNYKIPYIDKISSKLTDKINDWSDYIDFWAIDFQHNGKFFNPDWVAYRTQKDREITLSSPHFQYSEKEVKQIKIKTVDIMGVEGFHQFQIEN
ncbi:MAG: site-specific DNA-methyltransferase [Promethearchaeia archaeon]